MASAVAEFDAEFDVDTNARALVGLLTKSLDEAKNCDTGVKLRSGKMITKLILPYTSHMNNS